jgi:hypothetical protein
MFSNKRLGSTLIVVLLFFFQLGFSQMINLSYDANGNRTNKVQESTIPEAYFTVGGDSIADEYWQCMNSAVLLQANGGDNYVWSSGSLTNGSILFGQQNDTLTCVVGNAFHCFDTLSIHSFVVPNLGSISGPLEALVDSLVSYDVSYVDGIDYYWTITGGSIQSGYGTDSIAMSWNTVQSGNSNIQVFPGHEGLYCTNLISELAVQVMVSNDDLTAGHFTLFPNPSSGQVCVQIPETLGEKLVALVMNEAGELVHSYVIGLNKMLLLNGNDFPSAGTYHLIITNQDNTLFHHEKIIRCE